VVVSKEKIKKRNKKESIDKQFIQILKYRDILMKCIIDSNDFVQIKAVEKYNLYKEEIDNIVRKLNLILPDLIKITIKSDVYYNTCSDIKITISRLLENPLVSTIQSNKKLIENVDKFYEMCNNDNKLKDL